MINVNAKINDSTVKIIETIRTAGAGIDNTQMFDLIRIQIDDFASFVITQMILEDLTRLNKQLKLFKN